MRSRLLILVCAGLFGACGNERDKKPPPPENSKENTATKQVPETPVEQPTGEPPRLEIGDCYGEGAESMQGPRRDATAKLRESADALVACYRKTLEADASRYGGMELSFAVEKTGKARDVKADGFDDAALSACVVEHVSELSFGQVAEDVPLSCRLAFGYAPVKRIAGGSKRFELAAGKPIDWSDAGELPTLRAAPDVPAAQILEAVAAARKAGVEALAFETQRKGEWKFAYLPVLPSAQPAGPTGRVELTVFVEKARLRVGDTTGKRWSIPHAGDTPNFKMLADVVGARKTKPDLAHRTNVQLAPAADAPYGQVAQVMSVLAAQGFTHIDLLAWPDAAVKLDAPKEK